MTGALTDTLSVEDIERARVLLDQADVNDPVPTLVTTRQARCIYMVPGSVIRIMRHEPMWWRGDYLKVVD
jgi:hypothetical protein